MLESEQCKITIGLFYRCPCRADSLRMLQAHVGRIVTVRLPVNSGFDPAQIGGDYIASTSSFESHKFRAITFLNF